MAQQPIYIQFGAFTLTAYEGDRTIVIPITRSRAATGVGAEIHPAPSGTAKKGKDYLYDPASPPKIVWDDDSALTGKAQIQIQQNDLLQGDRTLVLHFAKLANCKKGSVQELQITIKDGANPDKPIPTGTYTYNVNPSSVDSFVLKGKTNGFSANDTVMFSGAIAPEQFHSSTIVAGVQVLAVSATHLSLKADTSITYTYPESFKEQSIAWSLYEVSKNQMVGGGGDTIPSDGQTHYDAIDFQSDGAQLGKIYFYLETNQATGEQVKSPELTLLE